QNDVSELCGTAVCLAQQLTHIELERLSYIGPEEFVQAFAKESPNLETSFKDMKKTRNLESYHLKSKKQRVRVVEFWIETGRECFNIGNFNSLMAIIAGLNMSPVSRLKRTVRLFTYCLESYIFFVVYGVHQFCGRTDFN
ncbi:hypothetical protein AAG570_003480, partial [Ranatra chinensis]